MLDQTHKILGVVNGVVWLVIGLITLYAIFKVGTSGVEQVVGGGVTGNLPSQTQPQPNGGNQQPAANNANGQTQPQPSGTNGTTH